MLFYAYVEVQQLPIVSTVLKEGPFHPRQGLSCIRPFLLQISFTQSLNKIKRLNCPINVFIKCIYYLNNIYNIICKTKEVDVKKRKRLFVELCWLWQFSPTILASVMA